MTASINLYVEVRGDDQQWSLVPGPTYLGTDYTLFSILAGVRNTPAGYVAPTGLSGRALPDRIEPIATPRGLPTDASDSIENGELSEDAYAHSWFTLRELLEVPWSERLVTERGWVNGGQYLRWKSYGLRPDAWMEVIHPTLHDPRTNQQMDEIIAQRREDLDDYVTMVEWTRTWLECLGELKNVIIRMGHLAVSGAGLDGVRIVFWFDN